MSHHFQSPQVIENVSKEESHFLFATRKIPWKEFFEVPFSRMLKKSFPGLFQPRNQKMRFPGSFIFNGLQPLKMAVYPYTAH
ncbi:hypothetical protein, partial [Thiolapillus sp.]